MVAYLPGRFGIFSTEPFAEVDQVEQSGCITLICTPHLTLTSGHVGLQVREISFVLV